MIPKRVPILEIDDVTKTFPGVVALDSVSFSVLEGTVHAVVGANGAGKSTLVKILAGALVPDRGSIKKRGKPLRLTSPRDAIKEGIAVIHQELTVVPTLSVAENIFIGEQPLTVLNTIDWKKMREEASQVLHQLGERIDVSRRISELSLSQQQVIEIARALSRKAEIILMDEPTSSLGREEVGALFRTINALKSKGVTVLYISHRLKEIFEIADWITVLRDGRHVATFPKDSVSQERIVEMMVGKSLSIAVREDNFRYVHAEKGERLRVENLIHPLSGRPISFSVKRGEIVGLAGLVGSGRSELLATIFGALPIKGGKVFIDGCEVKISSPREALRIGVVLVPEDRKAQGLVLEMALRENLSLAYLARRGYLGMLDSREEDEIASKYICELAIVPPIKERPVKFFSGGNQQKILIGRFLALGPRVLLLDDPTRGIDVGAKAEIHSLIRQLTRGGAGVVFVSSELPEVLSLADRILVMYNGMIVKEFRADEAREEEVLFYAVTGGK
jgi:ribose transport system ATP-binding protein